MLHLILGDRAPLRVVAIGAHPDDLEIGCGGTLLRLAAEGRLASVSWVVMSGDEARAAEAKGGAAALLASVPSVDVRLETFRDGYFPARYEPIKDLLEESAAVRPDLVLVPRREDAHQDHRVLGELAGTVFRNSLVLEYEIPKYDGDLGQPNFYVALSAAQVERKIEILLGTFVSQRARAWFTADTFRGLMRLRGVEARAADGFAEAFICRKAVV